MFEENDFGTPELNEDYLNKLIDNIDDRFIDHGVTESDQFQNPLDENGEVNKNYRTDRLWKPIRVNRRPESIYRYVDPRINEIQKEIDSINRNRSDE